MAQETAEKRRWVARDVWRSLDDPVVVVTPQEYEMLRQELGAQPARVKNASGAKID